MRRFDGKSVLVTGAASGIGLATTKRLAREGARVLACDINAALLEKEGSRLAEAGLVVIPRVVDITDSSACNEAVAAVVATFGRLDVLCNIAGSLMIRNFTDITDAEWHHQMAINVNGMFFMCRAAMPHLLETRGNIVNAASIASFVGVPYGAMYSATKGAVLMFTKALAVEYASRGVRVNAICPGSTVTPLIADFIPPEGADFSLISHLMPLTRDHADPDQMAATIAFMASDEAPFMTGSGVVVDGGQSAV